jgi:hypothetical protein
VFGSEVALRDVPDEASSDGRVPSPKNLGRAAASEDACLGSFDRGEDGAEHSRRLKNCRRLCREVAFLMVKEGGDGKDMPITILPLSELASVQSLQLSLSSWSLS